MLLANQKDATEKDDFISPQAIMRNPDLLKPEQETVYGNLFLFNIFRHNVHQKKQIVSFYSF